MNKKQKMYDLIKKHGQDLNVLFGLTYDPIELCKKLRRLEIKMNAVAVQYCNGEMRLDQFELHEKVMLNRLEHILKYSEKKIPVFVNGDPRGYALKIDSDYVSKNGVNIYRDWGGYGIIAPDLRQWPISPDPHHEAGRENGDKNV